MRAVVLVCASMLCLAFVAAEDEVTIKHVLSPAGAVQTYLIEGERSMNFIYTKKDGTTQELSQTHIHSEKRIATVMAIDGENITRLQLDFEYARDKTDAEVAQATAISGKSYIVELAGGKVAIKTKDGKYMSAEEEGLLQADAERTMKPGNFIKFLNGRKLKIGKEIDLPADIARELMNLQPKTKLNRFSMKLTSVKLIDGARCASFTLDVNGTTANAQVTVDTSLKGELVMRLDDCWPVSLSLEGPMNFNGTIQQGADTIQMIATGTYKCSSHATYSQKP